MELDSSRNEQVVLDTKLYLRREAKRLSDLTDVLCRTAALHGQAHIDALMPGYTHLQVSPRLLRLLVLLTW